MTETVPLPSVSLLPGMLPNEELFWHWRRGIAPYFDSVPLADPREPPQVPEIHMFNAGGFIFFDTKFSRQKFIRDNAWLRRNDDSDHVGLQLFLRGRNQVENGGRDFVMNAQSIFAVNLGYEIDAYCSDAEVLTVVLPRDILSEQLPNLCDARGPIFETDSTAGQLFCGFLHLLRRTLPTATAADAPVLTESLYGLLRALVAAGDPSSIEAQHGVITALQRYVDGHLGDPDLGVETLCAKFRLSRATLYRLMKDLGGVREYILRRRLMASFRALTAPANRKRRIFDIAQDFGFVDQSHFSARFRAHFSVAPSEIREAAGGQDPDGAPVLPDPEDGLPDVELMQRWTKQLGAAP